jgi:cell volume regulation protein A
LRSSSPLIRTTPLLQGPTLLWVARKLDVTAPAEPIEIIADAAPLDELRTDLLQVYVPDGSRLHGVEIFELRLPPGASIALIARDGHGLVPGPTAVLRTGDRLLIVVPAAARDRTERRLRAVSRAGKLAGWLGEHGD